MNASALVLLLLVASDPVRAVDPMTDACRGLAKLQNADGSFGTGEGLPKGIETALVLDLLAPALKRDPAYDRVLGRAAGYLLRLQDDEGAVRVPGVADVRTTTVMAVTALSAQRDRLEGRPAAKTCGADAFDPRDLKRWIASGGRSWGEFMASNPTTAREEELPDLYRKASLAAAIGESEDRAAIRKRLVAARPSAEASALGSAYLIRGLWVLDGGSRVSLLLLLAVALQGEEDAEPWPALLKWELARERVGHKVVLDAVVFNPGGLDLSGLRAEAVYYNADRELRRSDPAAIARLGPAGSAPLKLMALQVETFDRLELVLEHGARRWLFETRDPAKPPIPKRPPPGLPALAGFAATLPEAFPGVLEAKIGLKAVNAVREPVAVLTARDAERKVLRVVRVPLGDVVPPLSEDDYALKVPGWPACAEVLGEVAGAVEEVPAPGTEISGAPEVEVGRCRLTRYSDGALRIRGSVRNGTAEALSAVSLSFRLDDRALKHRLDGGVAAGATRSFDFFEPGAAAPRKFSYEISYESGAASAPPPGATATRTARKAAAGGEVAGTIPPPKQDPPPKEAPAEPALTAELVGGFLVPGFTLKNGKFSGDVMVLKIAFRDREGKPAQPAGEFRGTLSSRGERLTTPGRTVRKETWKQDAMRVTGENVNPESCYYDAKLGHLWVTLARFATTPEELRLDATFRIPGQGTWEWKQLFDPYTAPAKGPDKKN